MTTPAGSSSAFETGDRDQPHHARLEPRPPRAPDPARARPLELAEVRARLDSQLLTSALRRPGRPAARPPGAPAVQRQHQLRGQPFAAGVLGHQPLELADQRRVRAEPPGRPRCGPRARQPLLLQPRDLGLRDRLEGQVGHRRPRHSASASRSMAAAYSARPRPACAALLHEALEAFGIQLARTYPQPVARRLRGQDVRVAERLAQPRDVDLHRLARVPGRLPPRARPRAGPRSPARSRARATRRGPPATLTAQRHGPRSPRTSSGPRTRNSIVLGDRTGSCPGLTAPVQRPASAP